MCHSCSNMHEEEVCDREDYDTTDELDFLEEDAADDMSEGVENHCPLCHIDEVVVPHQSSVNIDSNTDLQQIMNLSLALAGNKPPEVIYLRMCEAYNSRVYTTMVNSGQECQRWTLPMVRTHFERHVPVIPRMLLQRYIGIVDNMVTSEHRKFFLDPDADKKDAKQSSDLIYNGIKLQTTLITQFRNTVAEDTQAAGTDTVWQNFIQQEQNGDEQHQLVQAIVQNESTVGPNDRITASKLFDAK